MKIIGDTEQDSIFTVYSLVHLLFGFSWYLLFHLLKKLGYFVRIDLARSFFIMVAFHVVSEIFENIDIGIEFYRKLGWRQYGGDHVLNALGDNLSAIVGFWAGYLVLRGASPKERYFVMS